MSRMMIGALGASAIAAMQRSGCRSPRRPDDPAIQPVGTAPDRSTSYTAVDTLPQPPAVDQRFASSTWAAYSVGVIHRPAVKDPTPITGPYRPDRRDLHHDVWRRRARD